MMLSSEASMQVVLVADCSRARWWQIWGALHLEFAAASTSFQPVADVSLTDVLSTCSKWAESRSSAALPCSWHFFPLSNPVICTRQWCAPGISLAFLRLCQQHGGRSKGGVLVDGISLVAHWIWIQGVHESVRWVSGTAAPAMLKPAGKPLALLWIELDHS